MYLLLMRRDGASRVPRAIACAPARDSLENQDHWMCEALRTDRYRATIVWSFRFPGFRRFARGHAREILLDDTRVSA